MGTSNKIALFSIAAIVLAGIAYAVATKFALKEKSTSTADPTAPSITKPQEVVQPDKPIVSTTRPAVDFTPPDLGTATNEPMLKVGDKGDHIRVLNDKLLTLLKGKYEQYMDFLNEMYRAKKEWYPGYSKNSIVFWAKTPIEDRKGIQITFELMVLMDGEVASRKSTFGALTQGALKDLYGSHEITASQIRKL